MRLVYEQHSQFNLWIAVIRYRLSRFIFMSRFSIHSLAVRCWAVCWEGFLFKWDESANENKRNEDVAVDDDDDEGEAEGRLLYIESVNWCEPIFCTYAVARRRCWHTILSIGPYPCRLVSLSIYWLLPKMSLTHWCVFVSMFILLGSIRHGQRNKSSTIWSACRV